MTVSIPPSIPQKYVPTGLSRKDKKKQLQELNKSRKLYKMGKYYTRRKMPSFKSVPSKHISNALKIYGVGITPSKRLAESTGCSVSALKKIVNKGEGAYYSSGSRPNQTARSWGLARLASAITSGKSAVVDFHIIEKGCDHSGKAYKLAKKALRKESNVDK